MPALRVFISSTMRDLDTERRLIRDRIAELNLEPVNAEDIAPTGAGSWERIERELETSHVMVLLQGVSYGWIPTSGPHGGAGKSITHLEYDAARALDIPILVFQKTLDYETDGKVKDADKRDAFRNEVGDWADGRFFAKWEHGDKLPGLVVKSLVTLLTDEFQKNRIKTREGAVTAKLAAQVISLQPAVAELVALEGDVLVAAAPEIQVPRALVEAVAARRAVLFAGAGISLAAGLPTHALFAARANQLIAERDGAHTGADEPFARLADQLDALGRRAELLELVRALTHPPIEPRPTRAHELGAQHFDLIVTSNYDKLFEYAFLREDPQRPRITGELVGKLPRVALVKLHGTVDEPATLLLGERETALLDRTRPKLWRALVDELSTRPCVIVGSSLRDVSVARLLAEVGPKLSGWFVAPSLSRAQRAVVERMNLAVVDATADEFFAALNAAVRELERS